MTLSPALTDASKAVGRAIARDVLADGLDPVWTGLDPQDGDQLSSFCLDPNDPRWDECEQVAKAEYQRQLQAAEDFRTYCAGESTLEDLGNICF